MQHPYLFFSAADLARYREKLKTDPEAAARYQKATANAQTDLTAPFVTWEEANGKGGQHANFGAPNRQLNALCGSLGLKYLAEGDERCAERLKAALRHYIGFDRWYAHSYAVREPNPWHSDLCSTATTLAAAHVFDIIHAYLTPEERRELAAGIYKRGVAPALGDWALPGTRIHALESMGHNWWGVCIAEAATALLALRDDLPEVNCGPIFRCVDEALAAYLAYPGNVLFNKPRSFDDGGMFYEGVGYDNYGTGTLLQYLWCSERYSGRNETIRAAIPKGVADAPLCFLYPTDENGTTKYIALNFCDSDLDNLPERLVRYALRLGIDTSAARALAATFTPDVWEDIAGITYADLRGSFDALPKTARFSSGYAITRSSWAPDATLLAVRSGLCWNHAHNDAGSFVIYHKGRPFFTDSGTCSYESPLYHAYYCQDDAHSVIRVGDKGQRHEELYRGTKFPGAINDLYEGKDFVFIQADAAGPMAHLCSRLYRNFLWIENRLLVIVDDIFCHEPQTVQFSLHYNGIYRQEGGAVLFENEGAAARVIPHAPEMTLCEKTGHAPGNEKEELAYIELRNDEKARTRTLFTTLELDYTLHAAAIEHISCGHGEGLRIAEGDTEREIWYNHLADGHVMHDNSMAVIGGFETDAYMLVITRNKRENTARALAVCASFLRRDGKTYLSSFAKTTRETVIEV